MSPKNKEKSKDEILKDGSSDKSASSQPDSTESSSTLNTGSENTPPALGGPEHEKHAPFMEHLQELATRIKWSILAIIIGFLVAYLLSEPIFNALTQPLVAAFKGEERLHFSSPTEPFFTYLTIALIGGIALAAPVVFYQLWAFVSPGLYKKEKRMVLPFLGTSIFFFFGGIAFGYFIVLPLGFTFLLEYAYNQPANFSLIQSIAQWLGKEVDPSKLDLPVAALQATIMMQDYVSLVMKLLLAFGVVFEMPLFIYFLARIGLITHKHLIKFFRYFAVIAFLIGALLTPPDVITQALMAGPMLIMYAFSILVAYFVSRGKSKRGDEGQDDEDSSGDGDGSGDGEDSDVGDTSSVGVSTRSNKTIAENDEDEKEDKDDDGFYEASGIQGPEGIDEIEGNEEDPYESRSSSGKDPLDELERMLPEDRWDDRRHT